MKRNALLLLALLGPANGCFTPLAGDCAGGLPVGDGIVRYDDADVGFSADSLVLEPALAVGDLAGDGHFDLVVGAKDVVDDDGPVAIDVHSDLQCGWHTRADATVADDTPGDWLQALAVADLDGTPGDDLLVAVANGDGFGTYLLSGPTAGDVDLRDAGAFLDDAGPPMSGPFADVADVTGDGTDDLLLATADGVARVFAGPLAGDLQRGDRTLAIEPPEGVYIGSSATLGDVDGDGLGDVAWASTTGEAGSLAWIPGPIPEGAVSTEDAAPLFPDVHPSSSGSQPLALADFDGDGAVDVLVDTSRPDAALDVIGDDAVLARLECDGGEACIFEAGAVVRTDEPGVVEPAVEEGEHWDRYRYFAGPLVGTLPADDAVPFRAAEIGGPTYRLPVAADLDGDSAVDLAIPEDFPDPRALVFLGI